MRPFLLLRPFFATLLLACASPSRDPGPVLDLAPEDAERCRYLGEVTENQYSGMRRTGQAREQARAKARDSAAKLGATHVVWSSAGGSASVQAATARAYACAEATDD